MTRLDTTFIRRQFPAFSRTRMDLRVGPGSGARLGMVITQKIITAHNGDLRIDSQPGKETLITFRLPPEE